MHATVQPVVSVRDLGRRYGGRTVVAGLSFALAPGALLGFVGANGGGKTTSLRMLAGLLRPSEGGGTVVGEDLSHPGRALRTRVGYMSQRLALYPDATVIENLRFRARVLGLDRGAPERAIERYGLGTVAAQRFERLSGGWGRRAQFAAAMLAQPQLLLLDEPTAGLDPLTRRDLWRWVADYAADGGAAVVSTHDLAEAQAIPSIIHFAAGRVHGPTTPALFAAEQGAATLEDAVLRLAERA